MQERTLDKLTTPSLTAIERINADLLVYGYCTEKTKQQIIDEEKTHAAEVVAPLFYDADVPRIYQFIHNDLVDYYGVSLTRVLDNGIEFIENNLTNRPGSEWEFRRRKIERNNLRSIIDMPSGFACIELSSTDHAKPVEELREWGYAGDSLIRISYKKGDTLVQRNIIVKLSDIKTLNMLRKYIDIKSTDVNSSEAALAEPQYLAIDDGNFELFITKVKNYVTNLNHSKNPIKNLASIVRKSKNANQNSWDFVNDHKIFDDLFIRFVKLAEQGVLNVDEINHLRAGVWQSLLDEVNNKQSLGAKRYSINNGMAKARSIGAVFTSCGGTISFGNGYSNSASSYIDRYDIAQTLLNKIGKVGNCNSCGSSALMYGCGVYCKTCNQIWCREYLKSGRQLNHKEVAEKKFREYFRWF